MPVIDLRGKRALVAGVSDAGGFGFAIAKALAECGASVCVASWPPAMGIFETMLRRGKMDEDRTLPDGSRVNATYSQEITSKGPTFTIRKFTEVPWTPTQLIAFCL